MKRLFSYQVFFEDGKTTFVSAYNIQTVKEYFFNPKPVNIIRRYDVPARNNENIEKVFDWLNGVPTKF